jgi:hypothetical protein
VVIGTDFIGNFKSNYHTITSTTAPVNIRLYDYWHKQVKLRKKRWNNKEIFIENKYVNRKLKRGWKFHDTNAYSYSTLYKVINYTLSKNAGFWYFLQIQALHCEFAEFLLHVGVFAFNFFSWYLQNRICCFYPSPRH